MKQSPYIILLFLLLFCGCFTRPALMTRESYEAVRVGTPIAELEGEIGEPYSVRSKGDIQEYEYIERINVSNDYMIENTYYLEILNGVVVGKRMTTVRSPAYNLMYQTDPNFSPDFSPNFNP